MRLHKSKANKVCPVCKIVFYRLYHKSKEQWEEQITCSRKCGKLKLPIEEYNQEKLKFILSKTKENERGCFEWQGAMEGRRYPVVRYFKKQEAVHRVVWKIVKGKLSKGQQVLHTCDNTICCNILHLFKGTHQDNMDDKVRKGRQAKGNQICQPMFTEEDRKQFVKLRKQGLTLKQIGDKFGTTKQTIRNYLLK